MRYWTTIDGRKIGLDDLTHVHLANIIRMLLRKVDVLWVDGAGDVMNPLRARAALNAVRMTQDLFRRGLPTDADGAFDADMDALYESTDKWFVADRAFHGLCDLCREAEVRGLETVFPDGAPAGVAELAARSNHLRPKAPRLRRRTHRFDPWREQDQP